MPADAVKAIFPKAGAPTKEPEPFKCSTSDGTSVVEISVDATSFTDLAPLDPCQPVTGIGVRACLQDS
jgi:hypothetical protein